MSAVGIPPVACPAPRQATGGIRKARWHPTGAAGLTSWPSVKGYLQYLPPLFSIAGCLHQHTLRAVQGPYA